MVLQVPSYIAIRQPALVQEPINANIKALSLCTSSQLVPDCTTSTRAYSSLILAIRVAVRCTSDARYNGCCYNGYRSKRYLIVFKIHVTYVGQYTPIKIFSG